MSADRFGQMVVESFINLCFYSSTTLRGMRGKMGLSASIREVAQGESTNPGWRPDSLSLARPYPG